jgi:prevent-host-death family protein
MARRMSAKEVRDNFSDVLGSAYYKNEPTIVERKGKPVAVVISPAEYERYQALQKERLWQVVDQLRDRNRGNDADDVLSDVTAVVEDIRQERHGGRQ